MRNTPNRSFERPQEVSTLLRVLETHHRPTCLHSVRVGRLARRLGQGLGLSATALTTLERAGSLHDIGKLALPVRLLALRGPLTEQDRRNVRWSVEQGYGLLRRLPTLEPLACVVLAAHEWFDGHGYPGGLKDDEIPIAARIIAVADAFDAMTQREWGLPRLSQKAALRQLIKGSGRQFDPMAVEAFLRLSKTAPEPTVGNTVSLRAESSRRVA
jgi:HD-GYP domain-containing protein (c-di-GMP phosphodiesterase class II)